MVNPGSLSHSFPSLFIAALVLAVAHGNEARASIPQSDPVGYVEIQSRNPLKRFTGNNSHCNTLVVAKSLVLMAEHCIKDDSRLSSATFGFWKDEKGARDVKEFKSSKVAARDRKHDFLLIDTGANDPSREFTPPVLGSASSARKGARVRYVSNNPMEKKREGHCTITGYLSFYQPDENKLDSTFVRGGNTLGFMHCPGKDQVILYDSGATLYNADGEAIGILIGLRPDPDYVAFLPMDYVTRDHDKLLLERGAKIKGAKP